MPNPFLPLVKGLAPRLDGKQDDENDGEKSTVCNNMTVKYLVHVSILPCTVPLDR